MKGSGWSKHTNTHHRANNISKLNWNLIFKKLINLQGIWKCLSLFPDLKSKWWCCCYSFLSGSNWGNEQCSSLCSHRLEILKTSMTYLNQGCAPYSFQTAIVTQVAHMCLTQVPVGVTSMVNNCIDDGFFFFFQSLTSVFASDRFEMMHYLNNKREEITVNIEQWAVILSLVLCVHQFGFWNIQMHQNNLTQFMIKCIRLTWMNTENVALQTAPPLFMGNLKDPHCHLKWETFCFFNQNFEIYTSWGDYSKVLTCHSA